MPGSRDGDAAEAARRLVALQRRITELAAELAQLQGALAPAEEAGGEEAAATDPAGAEPGEAKGSGAGEGRRKPRPRGGGPSRAVTPRTS